MNGSAKRMMAMLAVFAMIASAMVVVFADEQNVSADAVNPYAEFYGEQLESDLSKNTYIGLRDLVTDFSDYITVTYSEADKDAMADIGKSEYLSSEIAKGIDALRFDHPEINYYFSEYSYKEKDANNIDIIPNTFDSTKFTGSKTAYDSRLAGWIAGTGISGEGFNLIRDIHNYVSSHLNYDDDGALDSASKARKGNCRSVYNAFDPGYELKEDGKNIVVCEGYAKMFKVLCDHYGVPCIIATGEAYTGVTTGNHMWNYVEYRGEWFVVDCTWDCNDSGSPYDNYLLAGNDKTVNSVPVVESHNPCGLALYYVFDTTFAMPLLSARWVDADGDIVGGDQYLITFKFETQIFRQYNVLGGKTVSYPGEPKGPVGWSFLGWKVEGEEDYYDFSSTVDRNLTLIADGTMEPVFRIDYDSMGGTRIGSTVVLTTDNETKITNVEPYREEGFKFKEWNTSKDGTGLTYKPGDDITLETDVTLYAIWEDTNSVSYKIDSYVAKAAAFLSEEAIPGISNMLLTIIVITSAVSLLAILAISRK